MFNIYDTQGTAWSRTYENRVSELSQVTEALDRLAAKQF